MSVAKVGRILLKAADLLEAGNPSKAEALCRGLLATHPAQPDAWHIAGVAAAQTGRMAEARQRFANAILHAPERVDFRLKHVLALSALSLPLARSLRHLAALVPCDATVWSMLAEATVRETGQAAAVNPWRALAALRTGVALVHFNLGVALQEAGRRDEAVSAYGQAVRIDPLLADAHFNRANALRDLGRTPAAIRTYRVCLSVDPAAVGAVRNLGRLLLPDDPPAAVRAFRTAVALDPDDSTGNSHLDLAVALVTAERPAEALAITDHVLSRLPLAVPAHNHRAVALTMLGHRDEAASAQVRAIVCDPAVVETWANRAQHLLDGAEFGTAMTAISRALRLRPAYPAGLGMLARLRREAGHPEEAAAILRRAMAVTPQLSRTLHSDYLLTRQSEPGADPAALLTDHRRWATLHASAYGKRPSALPRTSRSGQRTLRIGYLSADFWTHSVAAFFEPLLAGHDRTLVETVCYSAARRTDATTARLRMLAGSWRDVAGLSDAALADRIRSDRIDVLIDLGGHTGDNRLDVLALAPAPVRLVAIGYPGTTGLTIEGRLSDPLIEPPGADAWSSEPVIRLPAGFLCFQPPADAPEPGRDAGAGDGVTFGSFNALGKLTAEVVQCWAGILSDVPGARLLLKSRALGDPSVATDLRRRFAAYGIPADRLDFRAWLPARSDHLALYRQVDVGLDPFPYNGTTTTCEAMWMGVPVVTLAGERHAARVGEALLTRVGLPELVAADAAGYRRIAAALAADAGWRARLRSGLRGRMRDGPLGDAAGLAAAVETACRALLARD